MDKRDGEARMRARDFWAAIVLMAVSVFFLWRTTFIQFTGDNNAGVREASWYDSAAVVPFAIFLCLLGLSATLLGVAIRAGAAKNAFSAIGIGWSRAEALRIGCVAVILFFYIAGLVPRVDFIIASGLLITALIFGFRGGAARRMTISAATVAAAGGYALISHLPQSEWRAHDDDVVALLLWAGLTLLTMRAGRKDPILRYVPAIAVLAPFILVCAMAFGFRQNVPNRGGLIFSQIERHYYVTLRPLWSG